MKRFVLLIAGLGFSFGTYKFGVLMYTLLASGQFFTTILATLFMVVCAVLGGIFIAESLEG